MNIIYAKEEISTAKKPVVFLAGPTPRSVNVKSWRPEAIKLFGELGFEGTLLIPEDRNGLILDYGNQVEWEEEGLIRADCIMFWIPRNIDTLPGFTTNIEWGTWHKSGKVILGAPQGAPKMRYIRYYANKLNIPNTYHLMNTINLVMENYNRK